MAEAKKMMESKEWKEQMKKLSNTKEFKESVKKTQDALNDPNKAAKQEAKVEHMIKVGQQELKNTAAKSMEDAMAAMANNPEMMADMAKMVKDPNFTKELQNMMANDPTFRNYYDAVCSKNACVCVCTQ